jgi:hypothetical protein
MSENTATESGLKMVVTSGQLTILILLVGVLVLEMGWQIVRGMSVKRQTWDYTVEAPPDEQFQSRLQALGAGGWEIVSARRATSEVSGRNVAAYEMILKRPAEVTTCARGTTSLI